MAKEEPGINRDVIVNPVDEVERNRKTDGDDHLIVLAIDARMIKRAVANIKKKLPEN